MTRQDRDRTRDQARAKRTNRRRPRSRATTRRSRGRATTHLGSGRAPVDRRSGLITEARELLGGSLENGRGHARRWVAGPDWPEQVHRVEHDRRGDDQRDDRTRDARDPGQQREHLVSVPEGQEPQRTGDKALHVRIVHRDAGNGTARFVLPRRGVRMRALPTRPGRPRRSAP